MVNRELLFTILEKLVCPPKFLRTMKKLYTDVHARVIVDGELTKAFEYNSGVKQGCKLALGNLHCSPPLATFKKINHTYNIQIRFRYEGDIFDLHRLKPRPNSLQNSSERFRTLVTLRFSVIHQKACCLCGHPTTTSQNVWVCALTQPKQKPCALGTLLSSL